MNEEQAVILAILLSKGNIEDKAPEYIREKIEAVQKELPEALLDPFARRIFQRWLDKWRVRG